MFSKILADFRSKSKILKTLGVLEICLDIGSRIEWRCKIHKFPLKIIFSNFYDGYYHYITYIYVYNNVCFFDFWIPARNRQVPFPGFQDFRFLVILGLNLKNLKLIICTSFDIRQQKKWINNFTVPWMHTCVRGYFW